MNKTGPVDGKNKRFKKSGGLSGLALLTSAAAALPGIANAVLPPDTASFDLRWEMYNEDAVDASNAPGGVPSDRYDIDALYMRAVIPVSDRFSFAFNLDYETMSGATPWYVQPDFSAVDPNTADPLVVMTGASVDDKRWDASGSGTYHLDGAAVTVSLGVSSEEDYEAVYGGLATAFEAYNKHLTIDVAMSFSADTMTPTAPINPLPGTAIRAEEVNKGSFSLYTGFTRVLNRASTFQSGVSYTVRSGFLSDPYKLVFVNNGIFNENRPTDRKQIAFVNRYRVYSETLGTAFHFDHRYYTDNWAVDSNTAEITLYKEIGTWMLSLGGRHYDQLAADFYEPFYATAREDGYYSSDYRLSEFEAISYHVGIQKRFGDFKVMANFERYDSVGDSPGLVDFNRIDVGFGFNF